MSTRSSPRPPDADGADASAVSEAFEAAYHELHRLAHRQLRALRPGDTLVTTALVNEAFLKLGTRSVGWSDRTHFFALAARAMRQILVDYARERRSFKRGGGRRRTTLDAEAMSVKGIAEEVLGIDRALNALERVDERLARLVEMRFFAGMTEEEMARAQNVATRTIRRDWQKARAFLYRELQKDI